MFVELAIAIIVAIISLPLWWYYTYYSYRNHLKIFPSTPQFPILGITYRVRNNVDIYYVFKAQVEKMGKSFFTMVGPIPALCTTDPKIFSLILSSPKHINKPFLFSATLNNVVGNSVLVVNGDEWRRQRKLLNPTLDYKNILDNNKLFNKHADGLIDKLKDEIDNESTEVVHILEDFTFDQTVETILGETGPEIDKRKTARCIKTLMKISLKKMFLPLTYFTLTERLTRIYWKEREQLKILHDSLRGSIERKRKEYNNNLNTEKRPTYMDILLGDKNNKETDILRQLTMVFTAAFDASAVSMSYMIYYLAKYPEIQQKAYEEVHSILGEDIHQTITNQQMLGMKYLDLVMKESMRLGPAIPLFTRTLEEDVIHEDTTLPKGLMILMIPFMMHLDPELYPEPEKFIPERFLLENLNSNRYSYTPFNAGIRNCMGQLYAMTSMKIALAKLLLNYEFVDVQHKICYTVEITLQSKTGVRVGIRKRNHKI
nr:cytochrome P450 4d2-like [Onthophagus taurus]